MSAAAEYFETGPKIGRRGRGRAQKSLALIQAAYDFLEGAHPTTVRGVCYRLFVDGVIPSMAKNATARVSRLLTAAREDGTIPWEWIVDETREVERVSSWQDPAAYVRAVRRSYRRDFWLDQPERVELWSEKGTIRGVLKPVLDEYGVGFRVMHGWGSSTAVHDAASQPLIALYAGDLDPSGLYMSEVDLPARLERYGGFDVIVERVALLPEDTRDLPSFSAHDKSRDTRYRWFIEHYGARCWEVDAMHPTDLRERVRTAIENQIDREAWQRCERAQLAEQESLEHLLDRWTAA
jgi:hypothetical protein